MVWPLAEFWEIAGGTFGVAAAIILVGGSILLRYQRDRHHFLLAQAAMEKGLSVLPNGLPIWVVSMRQGVLIMFLGVGILMGGTVVHIVSRNMPDLPPAATQPILLPERDGPAESHPGPADAHGPAVPAPPRVMPNPALERFRQADNLRIAGVIIACIGGIVLLLGIVRVIFARAERKYLDAGK